MSLHTTTKYRVPSASSPQNDVTVYSTLSIRWQVEVVSIRKEKKEEKKKKIKVRDMKAGVQISNTKEGRRYI